MLTTWLHISLCLTGLTQLNHNPFLRHLRIVTSILCPERHLTFQWLLIQLRLILLRIWMQILCLIIRFIILRFLIRLRLILRIRLQILCLMNLEDDEDDDVLVELTSHAQGFLPMECPFTFLCLSSESL